MTTEIPETHGNTLRTLDLFREVNAKFPNTSDIIEHKARGGKVIGWLCTYLPEEIIHAAGALPIRVTGCSQESDLAEGTAYLYVNNCSFSRSCLQLGLTGEYSFLDGVVGGSTCDCARRLFDLWRRYVDTPFLHILTVPRKYTPAAHELYYTQVSHFKQCLETFLEVTIDDEKLYHSISVYNESRELLRSLSSLRKQDNPPITGAQTMEVLNAGFRMPKEVFNQHLRDLLDEIPQEADHQEDRIRVMIVGSVMSNPEFIKSIEDLGGIVVTDELCTGTRYWSDPVVLDGLGNPLKAISRRYLNNFPCARMFPSDERFNRVVDLVRDFRVDGVISQNIRYCVPYAHDMPLLTNRLKKLGVPVLALDVEYGTSGSGQIQTRVQAFLEMVESTK